MSVHARVPSALGGFPALDQCVTDACVLALEPNKLRLRKLMGCPSRIERAPERVDSMCLDPRGGELVLQRRDLPLERSHQLGCWRFRCSSSWCRARDPHALTVDSGCAPPVIRHPQHLHPD